MKTTKPKTKKRRSQRRKKEKPIPLQSPKGMHDILPDEQVWWSKIRRVLDEIAEIYNFSRIDTPILEDARVLKRASALRRTSLKSRCSFLRRKAATGWRSVRRERRPLCARISKTAWGDSASRSNFLFRADVPL